MARGTAFSELREALRNDLGRSPEASVGVSDIPALKRTLNRVYRALYMENDWPHLRKVFTVTLAAGQRYYDFPSGLALERVEEVWVDWSTIRHGLERGINQDDMNVFDSDADTPDRNDPPLKWDVRWTGSSDQIEIWPIPATNTQTLYIQGLQDAPKLVNDTDLCLLDDDLVVAFAAAALAKRQKSADADDLLTSAQGYLSKLRSRGRAGEAPLRMGLGAKGTSRPSHITIQTPLSS